MFHVRTPLFTAGAVPGLGLEEYDLSITPVGSGMVKAMSEKGALALPNA